MISDYILSHNGDKGAKLRIEIRKSILERQWILFKNETYDIAKQCGISEDELKSQFYTLIKD